MGLFGKIFDKKVCDICGEEIKLLGNRKLEDGNLCKSCAAKLSPWFDERRHSTVQQIREQLEYREQNKEAVSAFHTSTTLGKNTKIYLDSIAGKFMVTSASDLNAANPDVLDLSQLVSCDYEIKESRQEEKRTVKNADGSTKQVSYHPAHYTYSYDFPITLKVDHPYFDEISFKLNSSSVKVQTVGELQTGTAGTTQARTVGQTAVNAAKQGVRSAVSSSSASDPRRTNIDYMEYSKMGPQIKRVLMSAKNRQAAAASRAARSAAATRTESAESTENTENTQSRAFAQAAAPAGPMTCPCCNATTTPGADGCCEYCGTKLL